MDTEKLEKLIEGYEKAVSEKKIPYLDTSEYIELANFYWFGGRKKIAFKALSNALLIHPDNEDILRTRIELLIDEGNIAEAREAINNMPKPYSPETECLNAEIYMEEGDNETAFTILDDVTVATTDPDLLLYIVRLYEEMDNKDMAMHCLRLAHKYDPNHPEVITSLLAAWIDDGKYEKVIKKCNEIIDEDPYSFFAWMKLAECYSAMSQHDKAIEATEFAMIADSTEKAPYILRGQSYVALENYEKALDDLNQLLFYPLVPERYIHYYIGICHSGLGNYSKAFEHFNNAEQITKKSEQPFHHNIVYNMAKCLYKLERFDEARFYSRMMISDSEDQRVMQLLLSNTDYTGNLESLEDWEEIVMKDPATENWYNLGICYLENKVYDKAKDIFLFVKDQEEDTEGLGLNLLLAYTGLNDMEGITHHIEFIREGIKSMDPTDKLKLHDVDANTLLIKTNEIFSSFFDDPDATGHEGQRNLIT